MTHLRPIVGTKATPELALPARRFRTWQLTTVLFPFR